MGKYNPRELFGTPFRKTPRAESTKVDHVHNRCQCSCISILHIVAILLIFMGLLAAIAKLSQYKNYKPPNRDSYLNLTLKSVAMLDWQVQFCKQATYLLKCDDDVYINTNTLQELVHNMQTQEISPDLIFGQEIEDHRPISTQKTQEMLKMALNLNFFPYEDVFITGMVASALDALAAPAPPPPPTPPPLLLLSWQLMSVGILLGALKVSHCSHVDRAGWLRNVHVGQDQCGPSSSSTETATLDDARCSSSGIDTEAVTREPGATAALHEK
ncbi:unnamed protein product [Notodromas monacha]|uniref:Hexosyltransferase n=1 Tax=Notodromas monacha TaxID=399045 RepID=A0A7R9BLS1_9CRUS|nr:unnamed protein product [Notodromas monacha]CAG0916483.1 unnamed protein product [Notodromas monacha]